MLDWFLSLDHALQALIATLFTWSVTALGAALVFCFKKVVKTLMDAMLGFAAGVMIAASYWSLLAPAIAQAEAIGMNAALVTCAGFLSGGGLLFLGDRLFGARSNDAQSCGARRCRMLMLSITLHNIPEGLSVGVAFGALAYGIEGATFQAACMLALGIGLQNFPEGTAVSVPFRREGMSRAKAFFYGQLSGVVEPIAGVAGAYLVVAAREALPYMLAFAAGAMVYVIVEELIPESQTNTRKDVMAAFTLIGFAVMMLMDVTLG